jgi:hypothetical protein
MFSLGRNGKAESAPKRATVIESTRVPKAADALVTEVEHKSQEEKDRYQEEGRKLVEAAMQRFGDSLEVSEAESPEVRKHLEDISLLPDDLVGLLKKRGLKARFGEGDVVSLSKGRIKDSLSIRLRLKKIRGGRRSYIGIGGVYDSAYKTIYAGTTPGGSVSRALHEYGHGVGDLLDLNNAPESKAALLFATKTAWILRGDKRIDSRIFCRSVQIHKRAIHSII